MSASQPSLQQQSGARGSDTPQSEQVGKGFALRGLEALDFLRSPHVLSPMPLCSGAVNEAQKLYRSCCCGRRLIKKLHARPLQLWGPCVPNGIEHMMCRC